MPAASQRTLAVVAVLQVMKPMLLGTMGTHTMVATLLAIPLATLGTPRVIPGTHPGTVLATPRMGTPTIMQMQLQPQMVSSPLLLLLLLGV